MVLTTVALHKKGRNGLSLLAANLAITINPSPPKSEREVSLIPAVNSLSMSDKNWVYYPEKTFEVI